jgi:hypothetical protein
MMQQLGVTHRRDHASRSSADNAARPIELAPLVGTWVNYDKHSGGIHHLDITDRGGALVVGTFGMSGPGPLDWGEAVGDPFSDGIGLHVAVGFSAVYELNFARVVLAAYLNKRLLVVDAYTTFLDSSGRSNYFRRDHLYVP